ncbi:MAG: bifunctional precorrin-2 dehydrogenase/sirohydrochlorin ferrochelatase [Methanobacterium sp.]|nr:bifunctional precorrin-2 dehydrogenase/sirohydrochlorin ferrochelatase [Methanobacterium sp.]
MGWTPLFLEMEDKKVLIVGSGEVGKRRTIRFLKAGANVVIVGNHVSNYLSDLGVAIKPVEEINNWIEWADIVITASADHELNQKVADLSGHKLVNRADHPNKGNLIVPSSFFIGDVQICIFTGGKSPLMSKELRKKIEKVISPENVMQLELQSFARNMLKERLDDQKKRRSILYNILEDPNIKKFLTNGKFEDAKDYVNRMIDFETI